MYSITYQPVGIVHSAYKSPEGTPIQPSAGNDINATIEIFPGFIDGLKDLEGFSHIYVLFHMHLALFKSLLVTPYLDTKEHGIFATRSPARPNTIGLSIVYLEKIDKNLLYIKNLDIVDRSPVLDIKPYIPEFDTYQVSKSGWLEKNVHKLNNQKDDGRFTK